MRNILLLVSAMLLVLVVHACEDPTEVLESGVPFHDYLSTDQFVDIYLHKYYSFGVSATARCFRVDIAGNNINISALTIGLNVCPTLEDSGKNSGLFWSSSNGIPLEVCYHVDSTSTYFVRVDGISESIAARIDYEIVLTEITAPPQRLTFDVEQCSTLLVPPGQLARYFMPIPSVVGNSPAYMSIATWRNDITPEDPPACLFSSHTEMPDPRDHSSRICLNALDKTVSYSLIHFDAAVLYVSVGVSVSESESESGIILPANRTQNLTFCVFPSEGAVAIPSAGEWIYQGSLTLGAVMPFALTMPLDNYVQVVVVVEAVTQQAAQQGAGLQLLVKNKRFGLPSVPFEADFTHDRICGVHASEEGAASCALSLMPTSSDATPHNDNGEVAEYYVVLWGGLFSEASLPINTSLTFTLYTQVEAIGKIPRLSGPGSSLQVVLQPKSAPLSSFVALDSKNTGINVTMTKMGDSKGTRDQIALYLAALGELPNPSSYDIMVVDGPMYLVAQAQLMYLSLHKPAALTLSESVIVTLTTGVGEDTRPLFVGMEPYDLQLTWPKSNKCFEVVNSASHLLVNVSVTVQGNSSDHAFVLTGNPPGQQGCPALASEEYALYLQGNGHLIFSLYIDSVEHHFKQFYLSLYGGMTMDSPVEALRLELRADPVPVLQPHAGIPIRAQYLKSGEMLFVLVILEEPAGVALKLSGVSSVSDQTLSITVRQGFISNTETELAPPTLPAADGSYVVTNYNTSLVGQLWFVISNVQEEGIIFTVTTYVGSDVCRQLIPDPLDVCAPYVYDKTPTLASPSDSMKTLLEFNLYYSRMENYFSGSSCRQAILSLLCVEALPGCDKRGFPVYPCADACDIMLADCQRVSPQEPVLSAPACLKLGNFEACDHSSSLIADSSDAPNSPWSEYLSLVQWTGQHPTLALLLVAAMTCGIVAVFVALLLVTLTVVLSVSVLERRGQDQPSSSQEEVIPLISKSVAATDGNAINA
jgi:hypothetical protein